MHGLLGFTTIHSLRVLQQTHTQRRTYHTHSYIHTYIHINTRSQRFDDATYQHNAKENIPHTTHHLLTRQQQQQHTVSQRRFHQSRTTHGTIAESPPALHRTAHSSLLTDSQAHSIQHKSHSPPHTDSTPRIYSCSRERREHRALCALSTTTCSPVPSVQFASSLLASSVTRGGRNRVLATFATSPYPSALPRYVVLLVALSADCAIASSVPRCDCDAEHEQSAIAISLPSSPHS